jgi:hypothetical protein
VQRMKAKKNKRVRGSRRDRSKYEDGDTKRHVTVYRKARRNWDWREEIGED